jgi:hypothetical protein
MDGAIRRPRRWLALIAAGLALLLIVAVAVFWDDLRRNALDPQIPFQTYTPPAAPDYAQRSAWYLEPTEPAQVGRDAPPVDIFFLSPTTYDGGEQWNAPIDDRKGGKLFERAMAPNYAGPFVRVGRIFAPRYRQASLYTELTLREDARDARKFAYGDVEKAFRFYLDHYNLGRPFILAGVEQGGTLASRLLSDVVAADPAVRNRLVVAYLMETVVPADTPPIQPCARRGETGCLAAWVSAFPGAPNRILPERPLVWNGHGELTTLNGRPMLCFNPLLGAVSNAPAPPRLNIGAANATGLEWDARPAFLARQVGAQCRNGILEVTRPKSAAFKRTGSWADRRKVPQWNLFYGDIEADARARVAAFLKAEVSPRP